MEPAARATSPSVPTGLWIATRLENARAPSGPTGQSPARVSHTAWTSHAAPTRSTGTLVDALEHHGTSRISAIRCDPDERNQSAHRRYAPTSVHRRSNQRSTSADSVFSFSNIRNSHILVERPAAAPASFGPLRPRPGAGRR